MGDFLDLPTLIIIGVAVVVLLRLRSVLGTRTGNERPPSERIRKQDNAPDEKVVPLRPSADPTGEEADADRRIRKLEAEIERFSHGDEELADGMAAIADVDADFSPKSFLEGAGSAYEMIVTAFASGDRKILKNLLEKEVYEGFEAAISDREAQGHKVDFTFVGLPKIEISDAELDKRVANVTIQFNAEVVSATRDEEGNLIEGNGDQVNMIADEWTFARNTRNRDPNWKLVATNQLD